MDREPQRSAQTSADEPTSAARSGRRWPPAALGAWRTSWPWSALAGFSALAGLAAGFGAVLARFQRGRQPRLEPGGHVAMDDAAGGGLIELFGRQAQLLGRLVDFAGGDRLADLANLGLQHALGGPVALCGEPGSGDDVSWRFWCWACGSEIRSEK